MFNHTSLNILKVLLTSFQLPPSLTALFLSVGALLSSSFAAPFGSPDHALLCCAFASLGRATFSTLAALFLLVGAVMTWQNG